ncbi:MAG: glycerate dehydrogenase, partial [Planctomycetaceae bacterium]|nr:glycerate dehydrogenase [Planctomycetaceae bacterium]
MTSRPKIVVLDGYALNPGDLDWSGLEAIGDCTVYDRTPPEETVSRAQGAEILLTNKTLLGRDEVEALPSLKYIGVLATGFNVVDLDLARELNITVTNIPTYGTDSVAQMAFALLLSLTQRVDHHARTVREGRWTTCPDFCYWDYPLIELSGLKIGIVGFGRIGRATGKLAQAFGMQVLAYDTIKIPATEGVEIVDLDTLFRNADVVSLHCPLTPETEKLVNRERLAVMK